MESLKVKRVRPEAKLPQRATGGSAGYDLSACIDREVVLLPGQTIKIGTGVAIAIEQKDCAAFIFARSGLATKFSIAPANCVGVIDSDYRGEIIVGLHNGGTQAYVVKPGERIAQMVLMPVLCPILEETNILPETQRGDGGFGSTGGFGSVSGFDGK